jgi:hypothetical protein
MLSGLKPATSACKAKALRNHEKYYCVFFLGTLEGARGKGYCSAMIKTLPVDYSTPPASYLVGSSDGVLLAPLRAD